MYTSENGDGDDGLLSYEDEEEDDMSFITIEDDIASVSSKVSRLSFDKEMMATGKSECTGFKSILYQKK